MFGELHMRRVLHPYPILQILKFCRQWGNILTLQAIYENHILRPALLEIIGENNLQCLFRNTMSFLWLVGTPTSALYLDWKILYYTGLKTGLLGLRNLNFP